MELNASFLSFPQQSPLGQNPSQLAGGSLVPVRDQPLLSLYPVFLTGITIEKQTKPSFPPGKERRSVFFYGR